MRYRKKPVVIDAVQWCGVVKDFLNWASQFLADPTTFELGEDEVLKVKTLEGEMTAQIGDWIIRGVKGEYYPCKPDIFKATYEPVEES